MEYLLCQEISNRQAEGETDNNTLGGCIYQLAVRCLDFNNFGSITIPPALPRICFWKGQTIKHFSDMLLGKDGLYGALQIKDEAETCYAQTDGACASTSKNSNIRKAIHRVLGNSFSEKIKEDIFLNFQERVKDQNLSTCLIAKQVLLDTLNIVSSSFNGSQHTEKLESSDNLYMPTDEDTGSGSTIRVDSNGIEINSDGRGRKKRMKTSTQQSETSTTKDNLLEVKIKGSRLEAAVEEGEAEMQSLPGNGHTKELEKEAVMEQTMQNSNIATQQPEMNMLDADTNIPKCNASDCSTQKEAPEKSTSLNYMLLSARLARALETTEQDMSSKDEASTHVPPTFSGFQHNAVNSNQSEKEHATTEMCKYRNFLPGFEEIDGIIDLTSPAAHTPKTRDNTKTCYYPMRTRNYENDVSSSQKNKKSYLTTPFIGKRLFTDEVIEEDDQDGTKDQPIPVIDELQVNLCFPLFVYQ
ncbi:uncharacterized protein [Triticum aestivum]|uniref:uncharacterized protein isoform X4 n=1 Tax=Triticum aestivum TaxID=4565 RepID=UPI001D017078|nr:uncharacterized protein LOC123165713 isoform X4 [Triticum aestivum]